MPEPTPAQYEEAYESFGQYLASLKRFADAMEAVGIKTRNVDPFANFAEVIVARLTKGVIQPATNAGFDVLTPEGIKIQVKSLRVSSAKPGDNGRGWLECTRTKNQATAPLIDAHEVAIIVYLDFRPYVWLRFPVADRNDFPVLRVTVMGFSHVERLIRGGYSLENTGVSVVDLRQSSAYFAPTV